MSEQCLHTPEVQPGAKCDCFECRTARMQAFHHVATQCIRCAGRCALDRHQQITCCKGDYACPVLDVWYAVLGRHIEPATVNDVYVELVYHRRKDPPKVFPRVAFSPVVRVDAVPDGSMPEEAPKQQGSRKAAGRVLSAQENAEQAKPKPKRRKR